MIAFPILIACSTVCASPASPITLNETKQLFLDDFLIASTTNVIRRIHPARKHPANPVIWPREEWEGAVALTHGSVIRDGDKHRIWYLSGPGVSYAESRDGIHWTKPELLDFGDTVPEHFYTNGIVPYFRAPHIYIAIAARFMPGRQVLTEEQAL